MFTSSSYGILDPHFAFECGRIRKSHDCSDVTTRRTTARCNRWTTAVCPYRSDHHSQYQIVAKGSNLWHAGSSIKIGNRTGFQTYTMVNSVTTRQQLFSPKVNVNAKTIRGYENRHRSDNGYKIYRLTARDYADQATISVLCN